MCPLRGESVSSKNIGMALAYGGIACMLFLGPLVGHREWSALAIGMAWGAGAVRQWWKR